MSTTYDIEECPHCGDPDNPHIDGPEKDEPMSATATTKPNCPMCDESGRDTHDSREYHNFMASKEWDQSEDNPNKPVVTFNALLEQTTLLLIAMKSTIRTMEGLSNANQSDLLNMEGQVLTIELQVLDLKAFFVDLEIGAS